MDSASQQKLKDYLDSIESNGEIAAFVMRRIRLERTFGQRDASAQIWAVNFAFITAIVQLVLWLRQLPFRLIFGCLATFRIYWAPKFSADLPITIVFIFALFAAGIAVWNSKKIGGENS